MSLYLEKDLRRYNSIKALKMRVFWAHWVDPTSHDSCPGHRRGEIRRRKRRGQGRGGAISYGPMIPRQPWEAGRGRREPLRGLWREPGPADPLALAICPPELRESMPTAALGVTLPRGTRSAYAGAAPAWRPNPSCRPCPGGARLSH